MLQVSLQTLNEWRKDGIIAACRIGNKPIRFAEQDIQDAIKKLNVTPF
jgi:predicted site-specific integrase-resolvase